MTLATFVILCKRQQRYGEIATTTDQITSDIVQYFNRRERRMWRRWSWDFIQEPITVTMAVGTTDYTLASTIGEVTILTPSDGVGQIKRTSLKRYHQWQKDSANTPGSVSRYVPIGRDSSGSLKIRVWPTPASSDTIIGFGKTKITSYTVSDIATNTAIQYFPEEALDVLLLGVCSDIAEAQGNKVEAKEKDQRFKDEMDDLIPDSENHPDEELSSPPPDAYIFNKRHRGGTQVA